MFKDGLVTSTNDTLTGREGRIEISNMIMNVAKEMIISLEKYAGMNKPEQCVKVLDILCKIYEMYK